MITMKAKYMLPLLAMSVASAYAGERETFDFGWKFKYFGSGDPAEAGVPATRGRGIICLSAPAFPPRSRWRWFTGKNAII